MLPRNRVVGVIVGMLEIPFCCTCIDGCDKIAHSTRVCEHLVVRGLFYTLCAQTLPQQPESRGGRSDTRPRPAHNTENLFHSAH